MPASKTDLLRRLGRACFVVIPIAARLFAVLVRFLSGAILCFFAVAPGLIDFSILSQVLAKPSELDLTALVAFVVCSALLYFLLVLAYRAFTNKGRKADGGLLPPWAMKVFVASFGVLAILIIIFGIYSKEWVPVVGGTAYLGTALSVHAALKRRQKHGRFVA